MDCRHFIKLTAISGTTAALTACGNPENQVIRFIPEDELVPGIATWKPSVCPLCNAGCGVIARVMEGDAEVFRNGQPGVIRMGLVKNSRATPRIRSARASRARAVRPPCRSRSPQSPPQAAQAIGRAGLRAVPAPDSSWDEAIKELTGHLDALVAVNDQKSLALLTKPRRGRRLELARAAATTLRRSGAGHLRVVFRRGAAARQRDQFRRASVADVRSRARALRARVRRGFPRHLDSTSAAHSAAYGPDAGKALPGARAKLVHVDARLSQTGGQRRRIRRHQAGHRRCACAGHRACDRHTTRHRDRSLRSAVYAPGS